MNPNWLKIENDGERVILKKCSRDAEGEIVIPDGVTAIDDGAFCCCAKITSIKIPNSVRKIGKFAFDTCDELSSIEIPDSVKNIKFKAFADCQHLKKINIPKNITNLGYSAFASCYSLKSNQIDKNEPKILAYKGFNEDLSCFYNFKYKVGESYHEDKVKVCERGFHACINPIDILEYYPNKDGNRFALVELSGTIDCGKFCCNYWDSKVAATDIKIIKELTFQDLIAEFNRLNK